MQDHEVTAYIGIGKGDAGSSAILLDCDSGPFENLLRDFDGIDEEANRLGLFDFVANGAIKTRKYKPGVYKVDFIYGEDGEFSNIKIEHQWGVK